MVLLNFQFGNCYFGVIHQLVSLFYELGSLTQLLLDNDTAFLQQNVLRNFCMSGESLISLYTYITKEWHSGKMLQEHLQNYDQETVSQRKQCYTKGQCFNFNCIYQHCIHLPSLDLWCQHSLSPFKQGAYKVDFLWVKTLYSLCIIIFMMGRLTGISSQQNTMPCEVASSHSSDWARLCKHNYTLE